MEIILGKTAGFCYGVERAVEETKKELEKNKNVYCLGQIVHNKSVIKELEDQGINFIENVNEAEGTTIIRAHGEKMKTYEILKQRKLEIIDLTCPNVLNTHDIARKYSKIGYYIILVGIRNHPESIATLSYCGENVSLIQEEEEVKQIVQNIEKANIDDILIMAQTTYNSKKFDEIVKILKNEFVNKNIKIKKTICNATEIRQRETKKIAKKVDLMIIIGDKKSSNTNKLYDISKENCPRVLFIQNSKELNLEELKGVNVVGVMAGASTPNSDIDEIVNIIKKL